MPCPTPFHPRTSELCTSYRWKEWAGYYAVCSYDVHHEPEYFAFRHAAGLIDVSPLFKYRVTGRDSAAYLSWVMVRDIGRLRRGRMTYTCLCDTQGKIIDDGTVARLADNEYRVTTGSPSLRWLQRMATGFEVEIVEESQQIAALALQGPTSRQILAQVTDVDLDKLRFFGIREGKLADHSVQVSRTGYTGDLGYEVWMDRDDALGVWEALIDAGSSYGLLPVGLDALDMTRVEAGFVLQDIDYYSALRTRVESRKSSPYELGLGWTIDLNRDPFVGRDALAREKEQGSRWAFVGLDIDWEELESLYEAEGLPPALCASAWRGGIPVFEGVRQVGQATSGVWSPILKKNLALASVEARHARVGTRLKIEQTVEYRRHLVTATVVETPFFDPERKKA